MTGKLPQALESAELSMKRMGRQEIVSTYVAPVRSSDAGATSAAWIIGKEMVWDRCKYVVRFPHHAMHVLMET